EELCDNIALINKTEKILDGPVNEIRQAHRSNLYCVAYKGNVIAFTNAIWTGAEILEKLEEEGNHVFTLRAREQINGNNLLSAVMPFCEIVGFNEIIPSMNDIFIRKVSESHETQSVAGTQSNFTE